MLLHWPDFVGELHGGGVPLHGLPLILLIPLIILASEPLLPGDLAQTDKQILFSICRWTNGRGSHLVKSEANACLSQALFRDSAMRFLLQVFFMNRLPQSPENNIRVISNFFESSRRHSQVKVHHRYQRQPVTNLPLVSTIKASIYRTIGYQTHKKLSVAQLC